MSHQRNTTGLRRSAQERHQAALIRTETALQMMQQTGQVINFRTVAAAAHVSTAWLYQQAALRARIESLRTTPSSTPAKAERQRATATQTAMLTALRQRIRLLEDENRRLKHQLEVGTAMSMLDAVLEKTPTRIICSWIQLVTLRSEG